MKILNKMKGYRTYQIVAIVFTLLLVSLIDIFGHKFGFTVQRLLSIIQQTVEVFESGMIAWGLILLAWQNKAPYPMKHEKEQQNE